LNNKYKYLGLAEFRSQGEVINECMTVIHVVEIIEKY
jgi:hypothetical protein